MKRIGNWVVSLGFVVIMLGVAVWIYPHLPAQTPTHWDAQGNINGWMPRFWAAAMWVLVQAGIAVLTPLLPYIPLRKFEIGRFARVYGLMMLAIQGALLVIGVAALLAGAGYHVPIVMIATLVVDALFMVRGNYMGKFRKNFFLGIRTPWTLASDAVWEHTHRLAGWLFVLAGLAWIAAGLARLGPEWLIAIVVVAGGVSVRLFVFHVPASGSAPSFKRKPRMKLQARLSLTLVCVATSGAACASPGGRDACMANAKASLDAMVQGNYAATGKDFSATIAKALPPAKVGQTWAEVQKMFGAYQSHEAPRRQTFQGKSVVVTPVTFSNGPLDFVVGCDASNQIKMFYAAQAVGGRCARTDRDTHGRGWCARRADCRAVARWTVARRADSAGGQRTVSGSSVGARFRRARSG